MSADRRAGEAARDGRARADRQTRGTVVVALLANCVRIKNQLRAECPQFDQVFVDIIDADRHDRDRARARRRELDRLVTRQDPQGE